MLALFLFSFNAYAASTTTCNVASQTSSSVMIQLDPNKLGVSSIDYQFEVHNNDGSQVSKTERIFSRWPLIRGEVTVDNCQPNDNEYQNYNDTFSLWSMCSPPQGMVEKIIFQADFSLKSGGKIAFTKADGVTSQELTFSNCH